MSYGIAFINVAATSDGDNALITGVSGKIIQVISYQLNVSGGTGNAILRDATAHTARATLPGTVAGNIYSFQGSESAPAFELAPGEGLEVNNAASVDVNGHLSYRLI